MKVGTTVSLAAVGDPRAEAIQLLYVNNFSTIWEYAIAIGERKISFQSAIGRRCPICGRKGCYREISPYYRFTIELFPFRKARVPIARFQCRGKRRTFSMLPYQLAPYHQYTVQSMMMALVLTHQVWQEEKRSFYRSVQEIPGDSAVTPWLLRFWLSTVWRGLSRAHSDLAAGQKMIEQVRCTNKRQANATATKLDDVWRYLTFFSRGPPGKNAVRCLLQHYAFRTKRFLLGTPSQYRAW